MMNERESALWRALGHVSVAPEASRRHGDICPIGIPHCQICVDEKLSAAPAEAPQGDDHALLVQLRHPKHTVPTTRERAEMIEAMRAAAARIESLQALAERLNRVLDGCVPRAGLEATQAALAAARSDADALRDALQRVDGQLSRVLHEMAGSVSLCWEPRPTGDFCSTQACEYVASAIAELRALATPAPQQEPQNDA